MSRFFALASLLACVVSPPTFAVESPFRQDCSLYMERELNKVPFDNAAKYATLFVVGLTVWEAAPTMVALGREEVTNDVRAALLRGAAHCLKDPEQRELAYKAIAIRKATKDWSGFATDLSKIAGMQPGEIYQKVVLVQGLFDDLEQGGETFAELGRVRREIAFGRKPSFQADLQAKRTLAQIFGHSCLPDSARSMVRELRAMMNARETEAAREMALAAQAVTGRSMSLEEVLSFNAGRHLEGRPAEVSRLVGARGDYRLIQEVRSWTDAFLEKLEAEAPKQQALVERLTMHLRDASLALRQCNLPRMTASMQLVSREPGFLAPTNVNRLVSVLTGETELSSDLELRLQVAANDACHAGVVSQYNDIVEDYLVLRDQNVPGRDEQRFAHLLTRAGKLAQACDVERPEQVLEQAAAMIPSSLDPGNLCLNAAAAESTLERQQQAVRRQLQACDAEGSGPASLKYTCDPYPAARGYLVMKAEQKPCKALRDGAGKTSQTKCRCCYDGKKLKGCFLFDELSWVDTPDGKRQKPVPLTDVPQ